MGSSFRAACKACGHRFQVEEGGGFAFHLLHCTQCGKAKAVSFEELGEAHLGYLKSLDVPYSIATAAHDEAIQATYGGPALSEPVYHRKVQRIAGSCRCGGRFSLKARPRCPQCRSTRLENTGQGFVLYD